MATTPTWETARLVTLAGGVASGVAGAHPVRLAGRLSRHGRPGLVDRLLDRMPLDLPDRQGGLLLEAPPLADRRADHLEPRLLAGCQVGRPALSCLRVVAVGPVGRQEG
jgi:hypothetical protein